MNRRIADILGGLDTLLNEQKALFEALPRAIRIAQIWPNAFKDGLQCSPILIGVNKANNAKQQFQPPYENVGTITRTYLEREDGIQHDITTEDFFSIISAGPE